LKVWVPLQSASGTSVSIATDYYHGQLAAPDAEPREDSLAPAGIRAYGNPLTTPRLAGELTLSLKLPDRSSLPARCLPIKSTWSNCHGGQAPRLAAKEIHFANIWISISPLLNYMHVFAPPVPLTSHGKFKLERGRAHHSRGPNSFYPGQDTLHVRWY
jgi:hypothetical protein